MECSVAVVDGFETLGYLGEDADFVDLIDVGDDVCVGSFVLEEEGADVSGSPSEHFMDRSYRRVVFDENGFYVNTELERKSTVEARKDGPTTHCEGHALRICFWMIVICND